MSADQKPKRLKLSPQPGAFPLWDLDTGATVNPSGLGLSLELVDCLTRWDAIFQAASRAHIRQAHTREADARKFASLEAERAWVSLGQHIAAELASQWPGPLVIRLSILESIVQRSMMGSHPWAPYSEEHARHIAQACGVAEIARVIERLDGLAQEKAQLPQWDSDTHEDLAKAQRLFAQILRALPADYIQDIASGLNSVQSGTRVYVAIALARHGETTLPLLQGARDREQDPVTRQLLDLVIEPTAKRAP